MRPAGGEVTHDEEPSDEFLAERVAAHDTSAFSRLYDRYAQRIYGWSAHVLGSDRAEDAIQEIFMILWTKAGQFDHRRGSFSIWFMAVTRHHLSHEMRRAGLRQRFFAAQEIDAVLARLPDDDPEPPDQAADRESAARILSALRRLPSEQRLVLVLAYFGGLSQSEMAGRLSLPLGTVKKRIRLGLQKLRAELAPAGDPDAGRMANQ
jgi:RNA polymerase sigma-70 factor (ECF subfamily)